MPAPLKTEVHTSFAIFLSVSNKLGVTVSQTDYNNMKFYVQHAAAAYCNYNTPAGTDITCGRNVCPSVQANKPVITGSWV